MRRAFTLIEVNLAMLIMAGGVLSIVGLYALGFRENSQSREDVAGAALADAVMSPLALAVASATDVDLFSQDLCFPQNGWRDYINEGGDWQVKSEAQIRSISQSAFNAFIGKLNASGKVVSDYNLEEDKSGLVGAVVISHKQGSAVVNMAFRATRKGELLFSQPVYYTAARFQGAKQ